MSSNMKQKQLYSIHILPTQNTSQNSINSNKKILIPQREKHYGESLQESY